MNKDVTRDICIKNVVQPIRKSTLSVHCRRLDSVGEFRRFKKSLLYFVRSISFYLRKDNDWFP